MSGPASQFATTTGAGHRYRWVMFAGMVGVYFAFGMMVTAIPPMITEVRTDLGMNRGAMGLALGAWTAMYIVTASFGGRVIDRIGVKVALALGGLSVTATAFARSMAQGPVSLWLGVSILGIGGPLISAGAPTLCGQWFTDDDERQFAVSIYNLGPGIGSIVVLFSTNAVLLPWLGDWRLVLRFEAAIAFGLTLVWAVIAWRAPDQPVARSTQPAKPMREEWLGLVRSAEVRHTLVLGALTFFVMHSLNNWLVDAVSGSAEITEGAAANWIAGAGMLGMGLLFVVPLLASRYGRTAALTTTWVFIIFGLLLVGFGPPPLALVGALATGVRATMVPLLIISVMTAKGVNDSNMGAANGLWFSSAQIGAVAGPFLVGLIADTRAGFGGAMVLLAAVGVIAIALIHRWDLSSA